MRQRAFTRPSVQPLSTADLVEPLFKWLKLDEPARAFRALRAFSRAAGPRIRAVARGEKLRGVTLYVRVATSAWSHELHALKAQLVDKLRRTPGGECVEEIRFNVGPLEELPDWDAPAAPEPPPTRRAAPAALPPNEALDDLRRAVEQIADPELRAELSLLCAKLPRSRP
jgi:hypothetical protein